MHNPLLHPFIGFAWIASSTLHMPVLAKPSSPFYLSSKGPSATIVAYAGLDTSEAVIVGQIQVGDAKEYCERDPGGDTTKYGGRLTFSQCVNQLLSAERGRKYYARANCPERRISDPWGNRYLLKQKKWEGSFWNFVWADANNGAILDGSNASGAPVITELYKVLCPQS